MGQVATFFLTVGVSGTTWLDKLHHTLRFPAEGAFGRGLARSGVSNNNGAYLSGILEEHDHVP